MMLDRKSFFDAVRATPFGGRLTQEQVDGMTTLLDTWERDHDAEDIRFLAYILAGVSWETGFRMIPVREGFAKSDAQARALVLEMYLKGQIRTDYAKPVNGISYFGRGRIQNTHLANYQKLQDRFGLPFVTQPDLLLDDATDALVTIVGHLEGIWTGKRLSDYVTPQGFDAFNARSIVNGDKDILRDGVRTGDIIAGRYAAFLTALKDAARPDVPVNPLPSPVEPDPPVPAPPPLPERNGPLWAAYVALATYFGDDPPKETKMVGGIIAGAVASQLTQVIANAVAEAVTHAASKPTNPLTPAQAPEVALDTAIAVTKDPRIKEIIAHVENVTNNDPPSKSLVTQGAVVGGVAGFVSLFIALAGLFGYDVSAYAKELTMLFGGLAAVGGTLWTLYGRWRAKKPLPSA